VMTSTGNRKLMSDLEIGDLVLTVDTEGNFQFSPIILFLDRDQEARRQFYVIETESGVTLTVTPSHLVYADINGNDVNSNDVNSNDVESFEALYASKVREGDYILVQQNGQLKPSRVVSIETKIFSGVFAPLTSSGNLVVDGALASCYAILENQFVSHAAFAPFRWSHAVKSFFNFNSNKDIDEEDDSSLFNEEQSSRLVRRSDTSKSERTADGIHWYADLLYSLAQFVMPERIR
jgi:hedgehog protein